MLDSATHLTNSPFSFTPVVWLVLPANSLPLGSHPPSLKRISTPSTSASGCEMIFLIFCSVRLTSLGDVAELESGVEIDRIATASCVRPTIWGQRGCPKDRRVQDAG